MSRIPDGWVARDKYGGLHFFGLVKPVKHPHNNTWARRRLEYPKPLYLLKDHPTGKGLTWEDEPRPVKLVRVD